MALDVEFKIAKIEAENLELKVQIATLQAQVAQFQHFLGREGHKLVVDDEPPVQPIRPRREPEVSITYAPPPTPVLADLLPSGEELQELWGICAREYPKWAERDEEWMLQFSRSIQALSLMRKLDRPDTKRYAHDFVAHAKVVLRSVGRYTKELNGAPFFMACLAMGVPVSGLGIEQCTISLGLTVWDGVGAPIDPGAWKAVLKAGRLPSQHRIERIVEQSPQVKIYGVGY